MRVGKDGWECRRELMDHGEGDRGGRVEGGVRREGSEARVRV